MGLIGPLNQAFVQLGLGFTALKLLLELLDLLKHALSLLLLLLKSVCKKETLLDSALGGRRCLSDGLD